MSNQGIVNFYYSKELPSNSVAIAKVKSQSYMPSDFISIDTSSVSYNQNIGIWTDISHLTGAFDYSVGALNQVVTISGFTTYYLSNQFFEITDIVDDSNNALFYYHIIPVGITNAVIIDENGLIVTVPNKIIGNNFYHSINNGLYSIRYVNATGFIIQEMLTCNLVITDNLYTVTDTKYTLAGKVLSVNTTGNYYIRFTENDTYKVVVPYNAPGNTPWFPRIRYSINLAAPEWAKQPFIPSRGYLLGSWITGTVLSSNVIQFDCTRMYQSSKLPDILIFDQNNNIKYAIDGTPIGQASTKGYQYNWHRGLISSIDWYTGRVSLVVNIEPTDIIFGFYSYQEKDVIFTDLDLNPFTNPNVRNAEIIFYLKNGIDPNHIIYYQVQDTSGNILQTNDPNPNTLIDPNTTIEQIFSNIAVGASISVNSIDVTDARVRGGGLSEEYQDIPQSINFWDIGFWNGKPYPSAGVSIIYLPQTILLSLTESEIEDKINSILPLGSMGIVKYYDSEGNES